MYGSGAGYSHPDDSTHSLRQSLQQHREIGKEITALILNTVSDAQIVGLDEYLLNV